MESLPRRTTTTSAYDHLLKILLVGDTSSNKSTLLRAYLEDTDSDQRGTTTLGTAELLLKYLLREHQVKCKHAYEPTFYVTVHTLPPKIT